MELNFGFFNLGGQEQYARVRNSFDTSGFFEISRIPKAPKKERMSSPANMKDIDVVSRRKSIKDIQDQSINLEKGTNLMEFSGNMDFQRVKIKKNTSPNTSQTLDNSFKGHHRIDSKYQVGQSYHLRPKDMKKRSRNRSKISEKKSFDNLSYITIDPSRIDMSKLYSKRMLKSHITNFVNGGRSYTYTHSQKKRVDYQLKTDQKILHVKNNFLLLETP